MGEKLHQPEEDVQVLLLQEKLDSHLENYHKDRVEYRQHREEYRQHRKEYREHRAKEHERWEQSIAVQERNTEAITALTESTKGLLEAWQAALGTVAVMSALGKFVKWAGGFAFLGVVVVWCYEQIAPLFG